MQNSNLNKENEKSGASGIDNNNEVQYVDEPLLENDSDHIEKEVNKEKVESKIEDKNLIEIENLKKENAQLKDSLQRERAEFMNFRKRVIHEKQKQIEDSKANFFTQFLPVLDNLDQVLSIETQNDEVKKYVEGVAMIRDNFINSLSKNNIKQLIPLGMEFDPMQMEAISSEERKDLKKETVIEVYQAGYYMQNEEGKSQSIRPARVKVGKPTNS